MKKIVTKFSGKKDEYATGATRDKRAGKGRYDLITPFMLKRLAGVYERGADNHGKEFPIPSLQYKQELVSLCTCNKNNQIVTPIAHTMLEDCAEIAMKRISEKLIRILHGGKEKIVRGGQSNIGKKRPNMHKSMSEQKNIENGEICSCAHDYSHVMGLLSTMREQLLKNKKVFVRSAKGLRKEPSISTTNIRQESLEDLSVENAIALLGSLEIALEDLNKHSDICMVQKRINFELKNDELIGSVSGDRNWEKGIPTSRLVDSAMRHINQFREGLRDEDHIAQAIWNLACIIHFEELKREDLNDVPNYQIKL